MFLSWLKVNFLFYINNSSFSFLSKLQAVILPIAILPKMNFFSRYFRWRLLTTIIHNHWSSKWLSDCFSVIHKVCYKDSGNKTEWFMKKLVCYKWEICTKKTDVWRRHNISMQKCHQSSSVINSSSIRLPRYTLNALRV